MLITNNRILLNAGKRNYDKFKVSVCNVDATKKKRKYTWDEKADLDIKTGNNKIGEIVNLAQILMSLYWDNLNNGVGQDILDEIHRDICQLNVLSNIEIDKAKKEYTIDSSKELMAIRNKYKHYSEDGKDIKPYFFKYISQYKGYYSPEKTKYQFHHTSMDYVEKAVNKYQRKRSNKVSKHEYVKFYEIVNSKDYELKSAYRVQLSRTLALIHDYKRKCNKIYSNESLSNSTKFKLSSIERQSVIEYIGNLSFTKNTMIYMLKILDNKKYANDYRLIFNFLFGYPNTSFYSILEESTEDIYQIDYDEDGEILLYNVPFSRKKLQKKPFFVPFSKNKI